MGFHPQWDSISGAQIYMLDMLASERGGDESVLSTRSAVTRFLFCQLHQFCVYVRELRRLLRTLDERSLLGLPARQSGSQRVSSTAVHCQIANSEASRAHSNGALY